jgi:ATP-dependent protease ClpP protease subunit
VAPVPPNTDRDFIMSAEEAKVYGLVDDVITNRDLAAVPTAEGTG